MLRVAPAIVVSPEFQVMFSVNSRQHDLGIVQTLPVLYDKYQLSIANAVLSVTPVRLFKVLVANFGKTLQRLAKHQFIRAVIPRPLAMRPTQLTAAEVLGIIYQGVRKSTDDFLADEQPAPNQPSKYTAVTPVKKDEQLKL